MANDLVQGDQLVGFAGAPYHPSAIDAAVGALRAECEWHIAPPRVDTWTIRTGGQDTIVLRTLNVEAIQAIAPAVDPAQVHDLGDGVLHLPGGWPHVVTITVSHGFEVCPPELLPLIAGRARAGVAGRVRSESIGGRSVTLESGADPAADAVLSKYMLGGRV